MKYVLVSTAGYLLLVDLETREVVAIECNRTEYYGVSWFPNEDELVLSHSGINNLELVDIKSYAGSELGWVSMGRWRSRPCLSAPHQILCASDGRIICTNTGRNVITVLDPKRPGTYQENGISSARWDRLALDEIVGDHLNSVFLKGNLLYVIAHGHNKGSRLAVFSYPGLELQSVQPLHGRTGLHNIWVADDGTMISCHSEIGGLVDLASRTSLWQAGVPVYTRGLAVGRDYVVVGESQKTGRDLRRSSLSGLWILERATWRSVDYLCLGPYGAVHEVRIADSVDEAHHGHVFAGLSRVLGADMRSDFTRSRLQSAAAARKSFDSWADYEQLLGSCEVRDDGSRTASEEDLCLAIRTPSVSGNVDFSYALRKGMTSHVSLVIGYDGDGGDTSMVALLIQPSESDVALSVWRHDGKAWALMPGYGVAGLPIEGKLRAQLSDRQVVLIGSGNRLISLEATEIGLRSCRAGVGLRWIGARVNISKT